MIVTCEQCETQFQLDDSRVPAAGVKVRCSRCKHAFFVKPEAPAGDRVEHAVEQAIEGESDVGSWTTQELRRPSEPAAEAAEGSSDKWEFEGDARGRGAGTAEIGIDAAREAIDDLLGGGEAPTRSETGSGKARSRSETRSGEARSRNKTRSGEAPPRGQPRGEEAPAQARTRSVEASAQARIRSEEARAQARTRSVEAPAQGQAPPASDAFDDLFDSDPDLGADEPWGELGGAEEEAAQQGAPGLAGPGSASDESDFGSLDDLSSDLSSDVGADLGSDLAVDLGGADAGAESPVGQADDGLGSPDDWDFFGAPGDAPAAPAATPSGGMRIALGRIGVARARPQVPIAVDAEPSQALVWAGRLGNAAGWLVTLLLGAIALHQVLPGASARVRPPGTTQSLGSVEARDVSGHWVENAVAGDLFVVSGVLAAPGQASVAPGARIAVRLLDARGQVIEQEAAAVGPALPMAQLRERSPRALRAELDAGGRSMAWTPLFPGETQPFQAVLTWVPPLARGFELVAVPLEPPAPPTAGPVGEDAGPDPAATPAT